MAWLAGSRGCRPRAGLVPLGGGSTQDHGVLPSSFFLSNKCCQAQLISAAHSAPLPSPALPRPVLLPIRCSPPSAHACPPPMPAPLRQCAPAAPPPAHACPPLGSAHLERQRGDGGLGHGVPEKLSGGLVLPKLPCTPSESEWERGGGGEGVTDGPPHLTPTIPAVREWVSGRERGGVGGSSPAPPVGVPAPTCRTLHPPASRAAATR